MHNDIVDYIIIDNLSNFIGIFITVLIFSTVLFEVLTNYKNYLITVGNQSKVNMYS